MSFVRDIVKAARIGSRKNAPVPMTAGALQNQWGGGDDWLPPSNRWVDTLAVDRGLDNGIVVACLETRWKALSELPFRVMEPGDEDDELAIVRKHPASQLLARPNPSMTLRTLVHYMTWAEADGNAYIIKERSGNLGTEVVGLWPLMPDKVDPITHDPRQLITHYIYRGGGKRTEIPASEVIHIRHGVDPHNPMKGMSGLKRVLREVLTDEEASRWVATLLQNTAVPSWLVSPKQGDVGPNITEARRMSRTWQNNFTRNNRGRPFIPTHPVDVTRLSFSPSEMDMSALRATPEVRVCAVMDVPPMLASMSAGLAMASGKNELQGLKEFWTEQSIIPNWAYWDEQLTWQLLSEFSDDIGPDALQFGHNIKDARAMQEDEDKKWDRLRQAFIAGAITRKKFKEALGLESGPEDDVYLLPVNALEVEATPLSERQGEAEELMRQAGTLTANRGEDQEDRVAALR